MSGRQPAPPETRPGREAQRRRTRNAIIEAATRLVADGASPSVDEIAAAADVSRRTIYMHFPTLDQLVLDATVGALSQAVVDAAIAEAAADGDAEARLDALVQAVVGSAPTTLELGRRMIALTAAAPTPAPGTPRRGYRRVAWLERALEPVRPHLSAPAFERLVSALALVVGWEAMIVLRDIRGLDAEQELDTLRWTATTLLRGALEHAD